MYNIFCFTDQNLQNDSARGRRDREAQLHTVCEAGAQNFMAVPNGKGMGSFSLNAAFRTLLSTVVQFRLASTYILCDLEIIHLIGN